MLGKNSQQQYWSIYREGLELIEGTEAHQMSLRFSNAGTHNSNNTIYVGSVENPVNPFMVDELVDAEGLPLEPDLMVLEVAKELAKDDREYGILLTRQQAVVLSDFPIWRLWTKEYGENRPAFEADYLAVKAQFPALPDYTDSTTYQQAADWLLAGIKSI